ncbi:MAG: peptidylprolyl isomerase [Anaerolineae bacterium]|nr:peptidylprolyl isomerase [Anaerolineae bacterium]
MTTRRAFALMLLAALLLAACAPARSGPATALSPPTVTPFIVTLPPVTPRPSPFVAGPDDYALGPEDAYLTILVYCDFQAPACAETAVTLRDLRERYADAGGVRTVWRHSPQTDIYDKSALAIQAAEAAAAQGAFWPMHDRLLERQAEWTAQTPDEFRAALSGYAGALGLDAAAFDAALDAGAYADAVDRARRRAADFDLLSEAVPVIGFNGERFSGLPVAWALDAMAQAVLLEQRQYPDMPSLVIDLEAGYRATLVTEKGDIVVELFVDQTPAAVNNFVFLARDGWYDNNRFFRVVPGVLAITGDPTNTGLGGPGYTIIDEIDTGLTFAEGGMVAMLRPQDRLNGAGSQFFITMGPLAAEYDGKHTIFGRVIAGMETLEALTPRDPLLDPLAPPGDLLEYILIEEIPPGGEGS